MRKGKGREVQEGQRNLGEEKGKIKEGKVGSEGVKEEKGRYVNPEKELRRNRGRHRNVKESEGKLKRQRKDREGRL